ncbi:amino acid transporter [Stemphylium lycopersici]|uniref:Amino acid transporter n=1 Tax=Stemphylium lycopersici TaxID=183478 RepID=A0A364N8V1_STELY|nr:amino acid transporter [Stemphylium lycopersici]
MGTPDLSEMKGHRPQSPNLEKTTSGKDDATVAPSQHLEKNFNVFSLISTATSLIATWEALGSTMATGLISGGPVALVYGYILAILGTLATAVSLSELASMYPSAGGQYYFVVQLAPKKFRAALGYAAGWISVFAWQTFTASGPFLGGTMIQALIVLNYPDYVFERWHGTMIYWAFLALATLINIFAIKSLNWILHATFVLHVSLWVLLVVVICVVSPTKHSAEWVFTTFINESGWSSDGVAFSIGLLSSTYVLAGYDSATHLTEEIWNPEQNVPRAMLYSIIINGLMGFGWVLAILFCMGDITEAMETNTGYPIVQIFYQITQTRATASAMACALIIMAGLATVPLMLTASRMLWSFANDTGLPFSQTLSRVSSKHLVPLPAIAVTSVFLILIGLLNIASTTAFNAIVSLGTVALYISYLMPICLILYRRIARPDSLSYGPFKLGRFGIGINVISIIYTVYTSIFLLFPPYQPVTAENMNYAPVVLGGVLVLSATWWFIKGHRTFVGPVLDTIEGRPGVERA